MLGKRLKMGAAYGGYEPSLYWNQVVMSGEVLILRLVDPKEGEEVVVLVRQEVVELHHCPVHVVVRVLLQQLRQLLTLMREIVCKMDSHFHRDHFEVPRASRGG